MRIRRKTGRIHSMEKRKRICLGVAAHVDAGKTTLCEAILYETGKLKKRGRVDHRDSNLDYEDFERERGITAFSKQAVFSCGNTDFTIIDTPGHADLFTETVRGLKVPDIAILVISGSEGVQADTGTIWELLRKQKIPTWIFVSKMDLNGADRDRILQTLKAKLSSAVTDFNASDDSVREEAASVDEICMEEYLNAGTVSDGSIAAAINECRLYPCFFGSGLHNIGIRELLEGLNRWTIPPKWEENFSGFCFKISRDARGQRLTQMKITGGALVVRQLLRYQNSRGAFCEEKVSEIRIYSGSRYETVDKAEAGQICSIIGLTETAVGSVFGDMPQKRTEPVDPIKRYTLQFEPPQDPVIMLKRLRELSEELPELHPDADQNGLSVCLNGKMQGEMLKALLLERFAVHVQFSAGNLLYRETVGIRSEGIGHFEPLRHYAEVHLILEPLPNGSGIVLESVCPEDELDRNWQNLILDSLRDTVLRGVLTGSELTDTKICLASGKAHIKHTEGGDFREATHRALRQGLMKAECRLLEPVLHFILTLPNEHLGRVISDLRGMHAEFSSPEQSIDSTQLEGTVPASELGEYQETLLSFTHGLGKLTVHPAGYRTCHNEEQVLANSDYDPLRDTEWPSDSVFCAHGSGFSVPWDKVKEYMHLPSVLEVQKRRSNSESENEVHRLHRIDDRELEEIMLREFGPIKRPYSAERLPSEKHISIDRPTQSARTVVIDGYNFIFADPELKALAADSLETARARLADRLANYCGFTGQSAILVYDGFRSPGNRGSRESNEKFHVVFTAEGETADAYIEHLASEVGKNDRVAVVTGDTMIRISAMRSGVLRVSPGEFAREMENAELQLTAILRKSNFLAHKTSGADAMTEDQNLLIKRS